MNEIGDMPFARRLHAIGEKGRVPIVALANQHIEVIESCRRAFEMPLADDFRAISRGAKEFWESLLRVVEALIVAREAVHVTVLARQHDRA